jgi:pimeloyl-ACP methyl ester carboxylesterase
MLHKQFIAAVSIVAALCGCASGERISYREGFAPVTNGKLYYQVAGSGDAIVLVHGIAGDHRHWDNQFTQLATQFTVIRYDVRGWGRSSDPVIGSPFSDFSDLAVLLNHIDVESAHVVGWSFGSGVAFDFATAYPGRAKSLVSVGPWVFGHHSKTIAEFYERAGAAADAASAGGAEAGANAFVDIALKGTIFDEKADVFLRNVGSQSSFWRFTNPNQAVALKPSAASQLNSLSLPILVITSENDLASCREMADFIVSNAPNSRQLVMPDTGHLMHIEKPEEFNRELLDFLDGVP